MLQGEVACLDMTGASYGDTGLDRSGDRCWGGGRRVFAALLPKIEPRHGHSADRCRRAARCSGWRFFALPILHRLDEINMRAQRVLIARSGASSVLTKDCLRADVSLEFRVRVAA